MASFNPLAMILNQKPLDGNKFEDWKTNLYIVLDYEKIKFVLDTPKIAIPEAGANDITKTEHATWENANTSLILLYSCQCCGSFEAANNTSRQWSRNAPTSQRDVC